MFVYVSYSKLFKEWHAPCSLLLFTLTLLGLTLLLFLALVHSFGLLDSMLLCEDSRRCRSPRPLRHCWWSANWYTYFGKHSGSVSRSRIFSNSTPRCKPKRNLHIDNRTRDKNACNLSAHDSRCLETTQRLTNQRADECIHLLMKELGKNKRSELKQVRHRFDISENWVVSTLSSLY